MQKEMTALRTIREVAEIIDVPQHVLRFWETRFPEIKPLKHNGGRRYYSLEDIELLKGIRHLLYGEGYTIRGVQRVLREEGGQSVRHAGHALCSVGTASNPSLTVPSPGDSLSGRGTPLSEASPDSEKFSSEAQQLSMVALESESPLPFRPQTTDQEKVLPTPARSLPKSSLPPLPKAPLPPPELFLGFAPDPTPRTKMGDDPHFRTSYERDTFLRGQLREALDHLKECKRMLNLVITSESDPS